MFVTKGKSDVWAIVVGLLTLIFVSCAPVTLPAPVATALEAQPPTEFAVIPEQPISETALFQELPVELRIAIAEDAESLDPARANPQNLMSSTVLKALYQTLVTYPPDQYAQPVPELAEAWEINSDLTEWIFHLKKDTLFADGAPVTATDVAFSFNRLKNISYNRLNEKKDRLFFLTENLNTVNAVDDFTVVLTFNKPEPALLDKLATGAFSILHKAEVEEHGGTDNENASEQDKAEEWLNSQSSGSGPYRLESWKREQMVTLRSNDNYKNEDEADRFLYVTISYEADPEKQLADLQAGEIDIALNLTEQQVKALQGNDKFTIYEEPSPQLLFLAANLNINNENKAFVNNPAFQQALRYAPDYKAIQKLVGDPALIPISFIPVPFSTLTETNTVSFTHDVEKAKTLLNAAGYTGQTMHLAYPASIPDSNVEDLVNIIQTNLSEAGLTIVLDKQASKTPFGTCQNDATELSLCLTRPNYLNTRDFLKFLPNGAIAESIQWNDDRARDLHDKALHELDPAKFSELITQAERLSLDDDTNSAHYPYVPTTQLPFRSAVAQLIEGFSRIPNGAFFVSRVTTTSACHNWTKSQCISHCPGPSSCKNSACCKSCRKKYGLSCQS